MRVTRQHVSLMVLVLTVLIAGCSGAGDTTTTVISTEPTGDQTESDTNNREEETTPGPTDTRTTGTDTTESTPSPTRTTTEQADPSPTATETGEETSFYQRHAEAADSKAGYRINFTWRINDDRSGWVNNTGYQSYDQRTLESFQHLVVGSETADIPTTVIESYSPPDTTTSYSCTMISGACPQSVIEETEFNESDSYITPFTTVGNVTEPPTFTEAGTVETDDGARERYTVTNVSALPASEQEIEYRSADIEVRVDPDSDLITDVFWNVTFQNADNVVVTYDREVNYKWLDSVDVEVPDWYRSD